MSVERQRRWRQKNGIEASYTVHLSGEEKDVIDFAFYENAFTDRRGVFLARCLVVGAKFLHNAGRPKGQHFKKREGQK